MKKPQVYVVERVIYDESTCACFPEVVGVFTSLVKAAKAAERMADNEGIDLIVTNPEEVSELHDEGASHFYIYKVTLDEYQKD